jgi:hypothetical protein
MNTLSASIVASLIVGFVLGNLSARYGFRVFSLDATEQRTLSDSLPDAAEATVSYRQSDGETTSDEETSFEIHDALPAADERHNGSASDPEDSGISRRELRWDEKYPDAPPLNPPHVADRFFFGNPMDPDVMRTRITALEEHIASLRQAGVPELEIQPILKEYQRTLADRSAQTIPDDVSYRARKEQDEGNGLDPDVTD